MCVCVCEHVRVYVCMCVSFFNKYRLVVIYSRTLCLASCVGFANPGIMVPCLHFIMQETVAFLAWFLIKSTLTKRCCSQAKYCFGL